MKSCLLIFCIFTNFLTAGLSDWFFLGNSKTRQFECPHHCGEFGSKSMEQVETAVLDALHLIFDQSSDGYFVSHQEHSFCEDFYGEPAMFWVVNRIHGGCIFKRYLHWRRDGLSKLLQRTNTPMEHAF